VAVLSAVLAPVISPHDPYAVRSTVRLAPPGTAGHWLGVDDLGRDVLSRVLWGGRLSLTVGFVPVLVSGLLGILIGTVAGFWGGRADQLLMRILDVLMAFPAILLAIGIVSALGPGIGNALLAMVVVSIPSFARIVRGSVLVLKAQDFVEAARASGAGRVRIIAVEILPNVLPPLIVYATLEMSRMVIFAAGLSFLGLGAQPPAAEWGAMLSDGRMVLAVAPHVALIPGLAIFLVSMSLNLVGDALRDALDPRLRI
jgi:peptide/nickel transport system permease protein